MVKMLGLDIETAPHKVYVWGLWDQNIAINQIVEPGYTLCWAAKWFGKSGVMFDSVHKSGSKKMLKGIHDLLSEADIIVHYNGKRFDLPTLNQEFAKHGLGPAAPSSQIDLYQTVRKQFKLASNKLDYVVQYFGIGQKYAHKGMSLWRDCMAGDEKAWRVMERYNKRDVILLEPAYKVVQPWVVGHPNVALFSADDVPMCNACGSKRIVRKGTRHTQTMVYARFKCLDCGKWLRGRSTILDKEKRKTVMMEVL